MGFFELFCKAKTARRTIPDSEHVPEHGPQLKFEMPADDEGSRKKRGAENQLTQHNWDNEGDEETPASVT